VKVHCDSPAKDMKSHSLSLSIQIIKLERPAHAAIELTQTRLDGGGPGVYK
jgi:hypothetical protein